jgi:hypothetical protein
MKKLFFLGACLVALASQPVLAQTSGADITVVRVVENLGRLVVVRPGGKATEHSFNISVGWKGLSESGQTIQTVMEGLYQEGYELKSTYSTGNSTTIILARRKQ